MGAVRGCLSGLSPRLWNIVVDSRALVAGLQAMKAGANFADGVIAYEGRRLGGATFVSFDKRPVAALGKQGQRAKLLR